MRLVCIHSAIKKRLQQSAKPRVFIRIPGTNCEVDTVRA